MGTHNVCVSVCKLGFPFGVHALMEADFVLRVDCSPYISQLQQACQVKCGS